MAARTAGVGAAGSGAGTSRCKEDSVMGQSNAEARFAQANQAYLDENYDLANAILTELNYQFPGNVNLLKAHARTLAKLGQFQEAIDICDRLENELGYARAASFRKPLEAKLRARSKAIDLSFDPNAHANEPAVEMEAMSAEGAEEKKARRFRIKPIRLGILILLVVGMYFQYVPYWLGGGLIAAYFLIKFALGKAFVALFSIPFKMKGKALAGATVELHGIEWSEKPKDADTDDDEDEPKKPKPPLRYAWLDVTITPPVRTQGFTHWEPGELMVAPSTIKIKKLDDMDKCFRIHSVKFITDGREEQDDEGYKVRGPQRIKLLAEFPADAKAIKFYYYGYGFGELSLTGQYSH
ncbi:MAG: hypothetical protein HUU46_25025 [Candidatus Hydrogenedentes bacterium]|nr:hypothetical protein [Candidatus Hydrogenedentota bacterium]